MAVAAVARAREPALGTLVRAGRAVQVGIAADAGLRLRFWGGDTVSERIVDDEPAEVQTPLSV